MDLNSTIKYDSKYSKRESYLSNLPTLLPYFSSSTGNYIATNYKYLIVLSLRTRFWASRVYHFTIKASFCFVFVFLESSFLDKSDSNKN